MSEESINYKFGKNYKLCSQLIIDDIFANGQQLKAYPFVIKFKIVSLKENVPFQLVLSAPKRLFRFAHQRNRAKRICKEAIRLNKHDLEHYLENNDQQLAIFLIYTAKKELDTEVLHDKTRKLFRKLITRLDEQDNASN